MRDPISVQRLALLHPAGRAKFKTFIEAGENELGITLRIVRGLATFPEQQAIYDQGRTKPGKIVTNAKPGSSYHNYGLATDLGKIFQGAIDWNFNYSLLQPIARRMGLIWGADWDNDGKTKAQGDHDEHLVDMPHYQITFGYTWQDLLKLYQQKDFIPGTTYLRLPKADGQWV